MRAQFGGEIKKNKISINFTPLRRKKGKRKKKEIQPGKKKKGGEAKHDLIVTQTFRTF